MVSKGGETMIRGTSTLQYALLKGGFAKGKVPESVTRHQRGVSRVDTALGVVRVAAVTEEDLFLKAMSRLQVVKK